MMPITIRGLGCHLPEERVTNADIAARYGPFVAALSEEMGVASRHWSVDPATGAPREDNAAIAHAAARRALDQAGASAEDLDLIIVATVTPDYMLPGPAAFVQDRLGATRAAVLDLRTGCFGLAQAVAVAQRFLQDDGCRTVLAVGSEVFSPLMHAALRDADRFRPRQRTMLRVTAALFGDGAGAMVLTRSAPGDGRRVLDCALHSIGCGRPPGILGAIGGVKMPLPSREEYRQLDVMVHDYEAIDRFFAEVACRVFDADGDGAAALDACAAIVPAQANGRIPEAVHAALEARREHAALADETRRKLFVDVSDVGNTGAASIYVALDKLWRSGRVTRGDRVLLVPAEATKWFYGTITVET